MQQYDVTILGGGLAALTLSIQIKLKNPNAKILVLEKRKSEATVAAHKVGESTVELAGYYFREILGLGKYLDEFELPKHGLRYYFKSNNKNDITTRVELGPRNWLKYHTYQVDRGTFENFLIKKNLELGTEIVLDARVTDVELGNGNNAVKYVEGGTAKTVTTSWIVDASSRMSLLKRKLGFEKPIEHNCNSAWFRVKGVVDVAKWGNNKEWQNQLPDRLRYLSTVHFLDNGYWVWIIPLGSKNTSIGIVADQDIHPFDTYNTLETAMEWLKTNEPQFCKEIDLSPENILDFKILKHFAHHSERLFDGYQKWAATGEAGAFLDPFYSPGSDLISLSNTLISDIILRSLKGEDVAFRADVYEQTYLGLIDSWIPIYKDKYKLMGNTQIMVLKIFWDWAVYWSVPTVLFTNNAFTDLNLVKKLFSAPDGLGRKFGKLGNRVQQLLLDWRPYENKVLEGKYIDPFDLEYLRKLQYEIEMNQGENLIDKMAENISLLEKFAAEIFRKISAEVKGTDMNLKVNPYEMVLDVENKLNIPEVSDEHNVAPDKMMREAVATIWFENEIVKL